MRHCASCSLSVVKGDDIYVDLQCTTSYVHRHLSFISQSFTSCRKIYHGVDRQGKGDVKELVDKDSEVFH